MKIDAIKKFEKLHNINLPKDVVSEFGIIGTLLLHPEFVYKSDYLKPNHFYNKELACVYHIIKNLKENGINEIDNFLIITEIEGNKSFQNIIYEYEDASKDINAWLEDFKLVSRNDIESYELICKKVVANAFKRDTYIKLRELGNEVLENKDDINTLNFKIQTDIVKYANEYIINTDIQAMGEKVDNIWKLIVSRRNNSGYAGIPSKYKDLNEYFTYENGELVVIGGRAKSGKSMFFLNEAIHKVENGVPTAIFDTEMSDERWLVRFLALKTGIAIKNIKNGSYSLKEEQLIDEAKQWLKDKPLIHIYDTEWTKEKTYMSAKQLKQSMNLGFLIYDYIKVDNTSGSDSKEHNVLGDMTNFLKNKVGGALDIAVLAGGQMSPKEQRLADSDKINRYASTIVYWIHKTKEEMINDGVDAGNCKMFIDYNRNGTQMDEDEYLNFYFQGDLAKIEQAKKFYNIEGNLPY